MKRQGRCWKICWHFKVWYYNETIQFSYQNTVPSFYLNNEIFLLISVMS